ncbi:RNA-directed DNA polymerase from mobile element jockey [Trichonephila clavipes]|nr:RNA-directed DNA polymerase from mobile element jockey [Trichonephila clavipes]
MRSGDLLVETTSAIQSKSYLSTKHFLDSTLTVTPHRSLNFSRGVISEPDLLTTPDAEILDGFSGQGVIQVRRITIKKDATVIPTKHMILTFNNPNLPATVKAGYLNCKIRPYVPNPLRCFKCQRFGHSQTACRGQLTCSRCASIGHASSDCTLEQKCVNCSQPHSADSKLCPKWKIEKEIQTIKTNRNISYIEARKFITPQPSQTYAQVAKSITVNNSSQTDETITKIVCPPLKLLKPLITISKPIMSPSIPEVIKSSTSTQAELVPSTSSVTVASPSQSPPPNSVIDTTPSTSNSLSISAASSSSQSVIPPPSDSYKVQDAKKLAKARSRKRKKELLKKMKEAIVDIKMNPHKPKKPASDESTSDEDEMIVYDVEDEIESNPDYVKENGKTYYKGQLLLTPTKHRK